MNVFDLEGSLSLDTKAFKKSIEDAKKAASDLGKGMQAQSDNFVEMQKELGRLANELDAAKKEIDRLRSELDKNADSASDMTDEVKKAKEAMDDAADSADDLGKEEKKTKEKTDEYSRSAENAKDKSDALKKAFHGLRDMASEVTGKIGSLASAVKDTLVKATEVSVAAIGAASAGLGALTKSAASSYGQYEQLVGGVETLFGKSANVVLENSEKAFKTAGMSMNDYMETSIQSAAALINSLGGDQAKAADLMDMSIIDMSDNVKKLGTSVEGVQNAYRGFSRGNFTMLDNLALGFSGTKEGMQELLDKAQELSGIKYDISSYSDIVQAIHIVQKEMGIAGTTAAEAAGTIQGSAGSMRAAWQNLVTSIANPKANLSTAIQDFTASAKVSLNNIMPIVTQALSGVGTLVQELAPVIAEELPNLISTTLPALVGAGTQLVAGIATGLAKAIPQLAPEVKKLVLGIATGIRDNAGTVITGFTHVLRQSVTWLGKNLPAIMDMGKQIISAIAKGFGDNAGEILSSLSDLGQILMDNVIKPAWDFVIYELPDYINTGLRTIDFKGIGEDMSKLVIEGLKGIAYFVDAIDWYQVGQSISSAITGIDWYGIIKDLCKAIIAVIKAAPQLIEGIIKGIDFDGLAGLTALIFVPKLLTSLASGIAESEAWGKVKGSFSGKMGEVGDEAGGKMGLGGKLVAAFEGFMLGWTIGTAIYNHWSDEIDSVLHPIFDKIVKWANDVKGVFDSVTDYAADQGDFLYDALHPDQGKFVADLQDAKNKAVMIENMGNTLQESISESSYEGALKSGAISNIRRAYSKYFSESEIDVVLNNAAKEYISSKGSIADSIAYNKYGLDYNSSPFGSVGAAITSLADKLKNINKHAVGGISVNSPVLTTSGDLFGEAGREAILPLDSHTGWMDDLADRVNHNRQPMVIQEVNINFPEGLTIGSDYDTDRMIERISEKLEQLRIYQNAAAGGVNW